MWESTWKGNSINNKNLYGSYWPRKKFICKSITKYELNKHYSVITMPGYKV